MYEYGLLWLFWRILYVPPPSSPVATVHTATGTEDAELLSNYGCCYLDEKGHESLKYV